MPGVGLAGPARVALGENSRMLVGGGAGGVGGVFLRFATGVAECSAVEMRTTDNMSAGRSERTRGERDCNITADAFWRTADNPIGNAPRFLEGDETPRIILWPDMLNDPNQYFKLPIGYCQGFQVAIQGNGDVRLNFRLSNQGMYYEPGNPDPAGVFA